MQLPNFSQAVRSVLYWRLYSAILTVGLLAHSCMACQAIRNQRTCFVIRIDDQGQAFVSNPLDPSPRSESEEGPRIQESDDPRIRTSEGPIGRWVSGFGGP